MSFPSKILPVLGAVLLVGVGFVLGQVSPSVLLDDGSDSNRSVLSQPFPQAPVPEPQNTQTVQAGPAWIVRCADKQEGQPRRPCEMVQSISMRETGQRVAEMALTAGYSMTDEGEVMDMIGGIVMLPLGIATGEGVIIRVDESEQGRKFPIEGCASQGCQARIAFAREEVAEMAKGEALSIITRRPDGRPVIIPMSLDGFDVALSELQRRAYAE